MQCALISVVVPIYNVEKYLRQCVDSILAQTLTNIEIILVDDGSTDNCPKICDDYAAKDKRIKVIHKKNAGLGAAYNTGIETADGEYIGFVEPDDFIAPNMYEALYKKIKQFNAELAVGSWFYHEDKQDNPEIEIFNHIKDNQLFSIDDFPSLLTIHPSVWAKLYKRTSIKNIRFPEFKGAGYCDAPFMVELFCKIKKIIGINRCLYYYRIDNENASSTNAKKDKSLQGIIAAWDKAKDVCIQNNKYDLLKEELFFHAVKPCFRFFCNIDKKYKKEFFRKFSSFIRCLKKDKTFSFKYFTGNNLNQRRKNFIILALKNDFSAALKLIKCNKVKKVSILGIPLWEKTISDDKKKYKILGLTIVKKTNIYKDKKTKIFGIFKTKKSEFKNTYYFLGIKIFTKYKLLAVQNNLLTKMNNIESSVLNLKTNILASQIHPAIFAKYANMYEGKDLVIVACGPSANNYTPIKNAIHIGINRAFKRNDIHFDYLFLNDSLYPEGNLELRNYHEDCIKFLGLLPDRFLFNPNIFRFQPNIFSIKNVYPYIIENKKNNVWAYNIAFEPFADFGSTVFSALQFALYTNPKKIYLVGCDCSSGYFFNIESTAVSSFSTTLKNTWKKIKIIKDKYYQDTEIISINPVGLKGLFNDIYIDKKDSKNAK